MRLLTPRGAVAVLLTSALLAATPVVTAAAAPSRPAAVGLVTFINASLTPTGATLSVDWADVPGAKKYEVFASTSYDGVLAKQTPNVTVESSRATIPRLLKGRNYYVQVRAVSDGGTGPKSWRVGHGTMVGEAKLSASTPRYRAVSWNICSYACSNFSKRQKTINSRIVELKPDLVALQEASRYSTAPKGYRFAVEEQNAILLRSGQFTAVKKNSAGATSGMKRFAKKVAAPGRGVAWAAVKHKSGKYAVVFSVHLLAGTSSKAVAQREYEAGKLPSFITSTLKNLKKSHGKLTDWTKAPVLVLGDFNTHKGRTNDDTMKVLNAKGWYDGFDQARRLVRQHHNTANPDWQRTPLVGIRWGSHVDKVIVRPSRSVVYRWESAGKIVNGKYAAPLPSDHNPLVVEVGLK